MTGDAEEGIDQLQMLEQVRLEGERIARLHAEYDFGELRKRLIRDFKAQVVPRLRGLGFEGTFPHFFRERGEATDLVMFQVDKYGGGFTIDLGRGDPSRPGREQRYAGLEWDRRARVTRDGTGAQDKWFRYDGPNGSPESQQDAALAEVLEWLPNADAWFRTTAAQPHVTLS